jgi:dGTPase
VGDDTVSSGYGPADSERWYPEVHSNRRSDFARDRARLLHSSALRRLAAKTQVLSPAAGLDFARNRLTHSLEVAQIGRELASSLGLDPDIVDTACLAHDLGHPPFGHNGERALNEWSLDIGGFEGNAQTLRVLTRIEPKVFGPDGHSYGLNLTRASLDASCKYPWPEADGVPDPSGRSKFGFYADDVAAFEWLRRDAPPRRLCVEAQVMDLSDDIAYSVHDFEDAVFGGYVDVASLGARVNHDELVDSMFAWIGGGMSQTSQLIGRFLGSAVTATRAAYPGESLIRFSANVVVPREIQAEIAVLKGIVAANVMSTNERKPLYSGQRSILTELASFLLTTGARNLDPGFAADWNDAATDAERKRAVVDQVASLTDQSAMAWHNRLVG